MTGRSAVLSWFTVVVNGVLAVGLLALSLAMLAEPAAERSWSTTACVAAATGGAVWLLVAASYHRNYLHVPPADPASVGVQNADGERAVVMTWRRTFQRQPLFVAVVVLLVALGGTVTLAAADDAGWWLPLVVVLLVGPWVPERIVEAARPSRLVLSPRGIAVAGPAGDGWLDWDDVRGIAVERENQWSVVRIVGVAGAASWRFRRRRRFVWVRAPSRPWLDVPGPAFTVEPQHVIEAIAHYRRVPAARGELASEAGRRRVLGPLGL
ncbi:hypothetical protein [Cellulomonas pakistanensis]|uniref:hypothetical protein n=1 Tax=Cellulomonas pakistanensis TaxID=992287 RepID=UPI00194052CB|nr:hypothetical protein [Cellulomonas pakistanensis]